MSLGEKAHIAKHLDGDLLDSYKLLSGKEVEIPCPVECPMPYCTNVYYANIPKGISGGKLMIYGASPTDIEIDPQNNMLVEFGEYEHEVSAITCKNPEDRRLSLVLLQNKYLNFQRSFFPDCLFSKG